MSERTPSDPLPEQLRPAFWDVEFERLRWPADRDFITRRILSSGSWEAIRWLRATMGDQFLRRWLQNSQGIGLTPRQLRFWQLILALPEQEVDQWIAKAKNSSWEKRLER